MATAPATCRRCTGQALLSDEHARLGWTCPHCGNANVAEAPPAAAPPSHAAPFEILAATPPSKRVLPSTTTLVAVVAALVVVVGSVVAFSLGGSAPKATSTPPVANDQPANDQPADSPPAEAPGGGGAKVADVASLARLRTALSAQRAVASVAGGWANTGSDLDGSGSPDLIEIEPSLQWRDGDVPSEPGVVFVAVSGPTVYVSLKGAGGSCVYARETLPMGSALGYAVDPSCGPAAAQTYGPPPRALAGFG